MNIGVTGKGQRAAAGSGTGWLGRESEGAGFFL